jgi:hypothetical protein
LKEKTRGYLPTCPFSNLMEKNRNIFKTPVRATTARGWQPQPEKPLSLNFGEGFKI